MSKSSKTSDKVFVDFIMDMDSQILHLRGLKFAGKSKIKTKYSEFVKPDKFTPDASHFFKLSGAGNMDLYPKLNNALRFFSIWAGSDVEMFICNSDHEVFTNSIKLHKTPFYVKIYHTIDRILEELTPETLQQLSAIHDSRKNHITGRWNTMDSWLQTISKEIIDD